MMKLTGLVVIALCMTLGACGGSSVGPTAAIEKADVIVTFDGARHACLVALSSESQGSEVPCAEVPQFLKDELRVMPGAVCALLVVANFDQSEVAKVKASLRGAGYRFAGGP